MENIYHLLLLALRRLYKQTCPQKENKDIAEVLNYINDPEVANKIIFDTLNNNEACMISRIGATEMAALLNYIAIKANNKNPFSFITCKTSEWWWRKSVTEQMAQWSGFFPSTKQMLNRFSELTLTDCKEIDILGSWLEGELKIAPYLMNSKKIMIHYIEPFFSEHPWTRYLQGKKVLVIHPFDSLIKSQYTQRKHLFKNPEILPDFDLKVIPAVQSLGGHCKDYPDWFAALDSMKEKINNTDFDICLIGCGAYGLPLAAHCKRIGKKAIHLGGVLQLMFGIRGKRWDLVGYGVNGKYKLPHDYTYLYNDYWIRPTPQYTPKNSTEVEGSSYW